jgi:hypothetical protein
MGLPSTRVTVTVLKSFLIRIRPTSRSPPTPIWMTPPISGTLSSTVPLGIPSSSSETKATSERIEPTHPLLEIIFIWIARDSTSSVRTCRMMIGSMLRSCVSISLSRAPAAVAGFDIARIDHVHQRSGSRDLCEHRGVMGLARVAGGRAQLGGECRSCRKRVADGCEPSHMRSTILPQFASDPRHASRAAQPRLPSR